jgi:HAD superfamily hydrolase (TIGR01509 family)
MASMADLAALLLDMDGTLVDTAEATFAAYAAALLEAGISVERQTFDRASHGRHWTQFLPTLLNGSNIEPASVALRKRTIYSELVAHTRLNRSVLSLAETLRSSLKVGLVTTASGSSVQAVLAAHGLRDLFDSVITGDDVTEAKPSPEAYLLAAERLAVQPAGCLVIEDSDVGVESARRAGMVVMRVESLPVIG